MALTAAQTAAAKAAAQKQRAGAAQNATTASSAREGGPAGASGTQTSQQSAQAQHIILHGGMVGGKYFPPAVPVTQALYDVTMPSAVVPGSQILIKMRNVGLVRRIYVLGTATWTSSAGGSSLTPMGAANFFSNVLLQDYGGTQRINCDGWLLPYIKASYGNFNTGALANATDAQEDTYTGASSTFTGKGIGLAKHAASVASATNFVGFNAPAIGDSTTGVVSFVYEIPLCPSESDLRGAIFAQVYNVTTQITLTVNPNFEVAAGSDPTYAVYLSGGSAVGSMSNFTIQVYQEYLDQLPQQAGGQPLVPSEAIGTAYFLESVPNPIQSQGTVNAYNYINGRRFLSTHCLFDNNGTLNFGTDINYIEISSANATPIIHTSAQFQQYKQRMKYGVDMPPGMYFFNHRGRPIDTRAYGNTQFIINPTLVSGTGTIARMGFESFGVIGDVRAGPALPT